MVPVGNLFCTRFKGVYSVTCIVVCVDRMGLEPTTVAVQGRCSARLELPTHLIVLY